MQTISSASAALSASHPAPRPARYTLALLVATFVLPFVFGTGLFWSGWRPEKFGNHGELIQPPLPMPEAGLLQPDGQLLPTSALRGKWLLVLTVSGHCQASCQQSLQEMSQVHLALNKDQSRLQRVFISSGPMAADETSAFAGLRQRYPELAIAAVDSRTEIAWSSILEGPGQSMFVADPLGNVVMRYRDQTDMRGVLKDLERLLKYSWIH